MKHSHVEQRTWLTFNKTETLYNTKRMKYLMCNFFNNERIKIAREKKEGAQIT